MSTATDALKAAVDGLIVRFQAQKTEIANLQVQLAAVVPEDAAAIQAVTDEANAAT